jgi:F420-non-reducing hydrogenase small subunit
MKREAAGDGVARGAGEAKERAVTKAKFAMYWAAACGGCEIAVLEIKEKILDVAAAFDIVFWPVAVDFKYKDVEAMEDGSIDITLFNGAIRNSENEHIANLLRQKSKLVVAFGACASMGGIPGLANVSSAQEIMDLVYTQEPSLDNPDKVFPQTSWTVPEGELTLPRLYDTVKTLDQTIDVDYYVPGCPPEAEQIWGVLSAVIDILQNGGTLPPKGTVLGAGDKSCCDECPREKEEKKITHFVRPWEINPDPNKCLLEQGMICMGPATRSGCGSRCTKAAMPCRGCYGPPPGVVDQGAKMLSTLASIIDAETPEKIAEISSTMIDPLGTFYRFGLAGSLLRRAKV